MLSKGRIVYVPSILMLEVEDIKREENIRKRAHAMRKLVEHARIGREIDRLVRLDWTRKKTLPPLWADSKTVKRIRKEMF